MAQLELSLAAISEKQWQMLCRIGLQATKQLMDGNAINVDMNGMNKCPKCGMEVTKVTLKDKLIGAVVKMVVCVDPAPTTCVGKAENIYHSTNCGHEWTE